MAQVNVGIRGIGVYLPNDVRKNDWWPEATVQVWRQKMFENLARSTLNVEDPSTEGTLKTLSGMDEFRDDPFKGAKERRVMPAGMLSSEMEIAASRDAISRAGIDPGRIGLLLTYSQLPDYVIIPTATAVHHGLGLSRNCMSMGTEGACNAFLQQFVLAEHMIKGGQIEFALLVQSSAVLHLTRPEDHHSVWFGDGATAVVVGPVGEGKGLLAQSHGTDGSFYRALVGGCPGARWYEGPVRLFVEDRKAARKMLLMISDLARESVLDALAKAGYRADEVDFYATHQSTHWFRKVTQEYIGLSKAKSFDSFEWTGSLGASNIPFMMAMGEREGTLNDGDLVAMHTGGSGITWTALVLRWGK